ncbi:DUF4352 domain-containing protein [Sporosarcina sp. NPDC096371]|uniref:DUF4352 domain-containing protein n=1 Tax=Sporosarcina sp. NPDC096371 TaxID=3364530 RepID=UPI00380080AD
MRKLYFILLFVALAGCSTGNNPEEQAAVSRTQKPPLEMNKDVFVPSPHITDDRNLVKIGESVTDSKGGLILKQSKIVNQDIQVGPVKLSINDIKVMQFTPAHSMVDFFHAQTHEKVFDFVKIEVEVNNSSKEPIIFNPIAFLNTNSGEHKTWEDDIYVEELQGEIAPNDVKKGNIGFILENTADIQSIELLTSDVLHTDEEIIAQAQSIKVDF